MCSPCVDHSYNESQKAKVSYSQKLVLILLTWWREIFVFIIFSELFLRKEQQQLATHPLHAQQTAARTAQPAHKPRTAHTVQRDSAIAFLIVPAANLSLWPGKQRHCNLHALIADPSLQGKISDSPSLFSYHYFLKSTLLVINLHDKIFLHKH